MKVREIEASKISSFVMMFQVRTQIRKQKNDASYKALREIESAFDRPYRSIAVIRNMIERDRI